MYYVSYLCRPALDIYISDGLAILSTTRLIRVFVIMFDERFEFDS